MRKIIVSALIAAVAMPMASAPAAAQSARELRDNRQDIREERRELRDAYRYGDRRDIRDERRDVRRAENRYADNLADRDRRWGRDDWRGWRDRNRSLYARGNWNAPFRYNQFNRGVRIAPNYWGQRYWINDPWRYRLPPAGRSARWIRHYNDVILVDTRRGIVLDVIRGFYW